MASRSRSRYKKKLDDPFGTPATSVSNITPNATLGSEVLHEDFVINWMGAESTNTSNIGEEDAPPQYASSGPALVDKYLQGGLNLKSSIFLQVIIIVWFAFISWLYIQDNQLGRLNDMNGIKWVGVKAIIYTSVFIIVALIIILLSRKKSNKKKILDV